MDEQEIGVVTHYFSNISVAVVKITSGVLRIGDTIRISGHTSDFTQQVDAMEIDHAPVQVAKVGDNVGMKVIDHAREHDKVYKVTAD